MVLNQRLPGFSFKDILNLSPRSTIIVKSLEEGEGGGFRKVRLGFKYGN